MTADGSAPRPRIVYVQYTNPAVYPPLQHSVSILANAGWDVLLLGVREPDDPMRIQPHDRVRVEHVPLMREGWRQKLHYAWFTLWVTLRARRWRPQWIYASDPLSCPAAWLLALTTGARAIYHEHDSPGEAIARRSRFMAAVLSARRHLAARAALCILPSAERAAAFSARHRAARVLTVWNVPALGEVADNARSTGPAELRVLYHGTIVPGRLPVAVVDAIARLSSPVKLVVVGYETQGHRGYLNQLRERAAAHGIGDRVMFIDAMPRAELMRHCHSCHIGLALLPLHSDDANERMMVGASNKPFDYMAGGLALVVSDLPSWRATFVEPGYALAADPSSADALAEVLRQLADRADLRRQMGDRGRLRIRDEWHYERAFAPVLALLEAGAEATTPVERRMASEPIGR